MSSRLLWVLVALFTSCTNKGVLPPLAPGKTNTQLFGTGYSDLWRFWSETPANAGQTTPRNAFLQHHDGSSLKEVTVPAIFAESSCGVPASVAALTPGKLWLTSQYVTNCGFGGGQSNHRIVLGTVARDGTWVDRSSDLPALTPPAGYSNPEFFQGAGLLLLRVRMLDSSIRWWRVTEASTTQLTVSGDQVAQVMIVDATHVFGVAGNGGTFTHRLEGDAFVPLAAAMEVPSGNVTRAGPETWIWNANDVIHQESNRVAFRFDGTGFQRISFQIDDPQKGGYSWQAVGAVPRGNGKLTLLGTHVGTGIYAYSEHDLTTRQLTGEKLTGEVVVFGTMTCDGSNQSGKECLRAGSRHEKTLDDGTIVLRGSSGAETGAEVMIVRPTDLP